MPSDIKWSSRISKSLTQFEEPPTVTDSDSAEAYLPHNFGLSARLDNDSAMSSAATKIVFDDYVHALWNRYTVERGNLQKPKLPTEESGGDYGFHQRDALWEEIDYMMVHQETGGPFIVVSYYTPATLPSNSQTGGYTKTRTNVKWLAPGDGTIASRITTNNDAWNLQPEIVVIPFDENLFPSGYKSNFLDHGNTVYSNAFSEYGTGDGVFRDSESIYFGTRALQDKASYGSNFPDTYPSGTFTSSSFHSDISLSNKFIAPDLITTPYSWEEYENALKVKSEVKHTAGPLLKGKGYGEEKYTEYEKKVTDETFLNSGHTLYANGPNLVDAFGLTIKPFLGATESSLTGAGRLVHGSFSDTSPLVTSAVNSSSLRGVNDGNSYETALCIEFCDMLKIGQVVRYSSFRPTTAAGTQDKFEMVMEYFDNLANSTSPTYTSVMVLASGPHLYLNPEQRGSGAARDQGSYSSDVTRDTYKGTNVKDFDKHFTNFIPNRTEYNFSQYQLDNEDDIKSDNILNYADYIDAGERNIGTSGQNVVQGNWIFSPLRYMGSHKRKQAGLGTCSTTANNPSFNLSTFGASSPMHYEKCPSGFGSYAGPDGPMVADKPLWASYELAIDYIVNEHADIRQGNAQLAVSNTEDQIHLSKRCPYAQDPEVISGRAGDYSTPGGTSADRIEEFGSSLFNPDNGYRRADENDWDSTINTAKTNYHSTQFLNDIDYSTLDARTSDGRWIRDGFYDLSSFDSSLITHSRALNIDNIQDASSISNSAKGDGSEYMGILSRFSALPGQWKGKIDFTQGSSTSPGLLSSVDSTCNGFEGGGYWFHEKDNGKYVYPLFGSKTEADLFGRYIDKILPNAGITPTSSLGASEPYTPTISQSSVPYKITMHSEIYGSTNASEEKTFWMPKNMQFTNSDHRPSGAHTANGYLRPKQIKCVYFVDNGDGTYTFPVFKSIASYTECRHDPAFYLGEAIQAHLEYETDMIALKNSRYGTNGSNNVFNYKFNTSIYPGAHPQNPVLASPTNSTSVESYTSTTASDGVDISFSNLNTTNKTRPVTGVQYEELSAATFDSQTISTVKDKHHRTWYVDNQTPHVFDVHPRDIISKESTNDGHNWKTESGSTRPSAPINSTELWWNGRQADAAPSDDDFFNYEPITDYKTWQRFQNVEELPDATDGVLDSNGDGQHSVYYYYDEDTGLFYYPLYRNIEEVYDVQLNFNTYFPGLGVPNFTGTHGEFTVRGDTWYFPRNAGISTYTNGTTSVPGGIVVWSPSYSDMPNAFGTDIPT